MEKDAVTFTARQFKLWKREGDDLGAIGSNVIKMAGGDEHLPAGAEGAEEQGINLFVNQAPVWNEREEMYCLDFRGRVTVASVKNFLLERPVREALDAGGSSSAGCDPRDSTAAPVTPPPRETVMIFGRTGYEPDAYSLDYSFPFSPFQAFCVALSSVDSHLICE